MRTREFLWNEGHNVFSNPKDLEKDKKAVTSIYESFMSEYMALPSMLGKKSSKEKFAGAVATYSFELMLPNGKAIQGPDYHDDGQNFAKAYNIKFLDQKGKEQYAYQSTFAITTRMLGVMIAIHSDNKGLVIPPKLAENKVVIVPILFDKTKSKVMKEAEKISKELAEYNAILDSREDVSPGWKYNVWELKGIPLRIEIGPRDLEKKSVMISKRTGEDKMQIKIKDIKKIVPTLLEDMQVELYENAKKLLTSSITKANTLAELNKAIKNKKITLVPMCDNVKCEDIVKEQPGEQKLLTPH